MAFNKVILEGRLCADPDIRTAQSGNNVARFRLAVDRQKKGEADFINCVAFGQTADFLGQWFKKGKPALIEGHITTGSYTDKDGAKRSTVDVVADRATFTVSDRGEQTQAAAAEDDGDLPF